MSGLPSQPFFNAPVQRVALARERFFDRGERPTGLVSEAVIQSWTRCLGARNDPQRVVAFDPVTRSRLHATLERNRALLQAATDDITRLEAALAGTGARVLLTDPQGVIIHATQGTGSGDEQLLPLVSRPGVNIDEVAVGTNAPAMVAKTGQAVTVTAAEHFYDCMHRLRCAAAPIRDGQGRVAGVLDLTVEARPFAFDAAALVGVYATLIENRLLLASSSEHLVLRFQVCSSMIGSPLEALAGIASDGRLAWQNGTAQQLLGLQPRETPDAESVLGTPVSQLLAQTREDAPMPLRLPNGLTVWLRARQPGPAVTAPAPIQAEVPAAATAMESTLGESTQQLIANTLAECGGNISRAARRLGVSRGLLYRRLRSAGLSE